MKPFRGDRLIHKDMSRLLPEDTILYTAVNDGRSPALHILDRGWDGLA